MWSKINYVNLSSKFYISLSYVTLISLSYENCNWLSISHFACFFVILKPSHVKINQCFYFCSSPLVRFLIFWKSLKRLCSKGFGESLWTLFKKVCKTYLPTIIRKTDVVAQTLVKSRLSRFFWIKIYTYYTFKKVKFFIKICQKDL